MMTEHPRQLRPHRRLSDVQLNELIKSLRLEQRFRREDASLVCTERERWHRPRGLTRGDRLTVMRREMVRLWRAP
jgi:hypothetical protein